MATYTYAKYVDVNELKDEIFKAGYDSYIASINLRGKLLTIETKFDLTQDEQDLFRKIILAHTPIDPAVAAAKIKVDDAMTFGKSIITEYAAMNSLAKLPLPIIEQILIQLLPIQAALQSGSLYTAIDLMNKVPNSPYLPRKTLMYFINKIQKYLGVPLT